MATPTDPTVPPSAGPPSEGPPLDVPPLPPPPPPWPPPEGQGPPGAGPTGGNGADEASRFAPYLRLLRRFVRTVSSIFQAHVMVIQDEAGREALRVATGVVLILGTLLFMGVTGLLAAVAALGLVQRLTDLPWLESIALTAAGTGTFALLLAIGAWLRLRKPLLPRSRQLLRSTFEGILKG